MDTITTLLRVTGLMFAAAGLFAAVLALPWAGAEREHLEKATDASVLGKSGNFPHGAVLVVNESILANGLA